MPSIGARLFATTAIALAGLAVGACQSMQQNEAASLENAVHTKALIEEVASRAERGGERLAERAEQARRAGDLDLAINLAENAVAFDTEDEAARRTLATSYFAAGRLQSAAEAYADLIAMNPASDTYKFGAALTALAGGDTARAHVLLGELAAQPALAGDVGLAYVLLGEMDRGKSLLESAVRSGTSTSQTRQNLALAQALSGDWSLARVTAGIDLPPAQVDQRVAEWAALSISEDTAWRTAMLLKLNPVFGDPGRPEALAWIPPADPSAAQTASAATEGAEGEMEFPPAPLSVDAARESAMPRIDKVDVPVPTQQSARLSTAPTAPKESQNEDILSQAKSEPQPLEEIEKVSQISTAPEPLPKAGQGSWLVQLGAYDRPQGLTQNWKALKVRNEFLSNYQPIQSKADVEGRTYYRLSVGRFDNCDDAGILCDAVKAAGGNCFVRKSKNNA